ncbi:uncharacterized protein JCM6883_005009 [Sporobolomyces salmoneus]|uniref:uncharacterized protein n=1 Tax=Sporobolomyces salmoneus TaxID=183962 RepID=UPI003175DEA8
MSIGKKQRVAASTRLPPEVLLDILSDATTRTLRSAALVHPTWKGPSQYLLHQEVSLPSRKIAKSFLQVQGRTQYSKKLSLPISLDIDDSCEILESTKGLQDLVLVSTEGATGKSKFEVELLEASSLAGLRSLQLTAPFSEPIDRCIHPSASFTFPFRLKALSFKGTYDSYPSALLHGLADSSSTSITSLDLDVYGSQASATRFFDGLLALAPHLEHVEIHGSDRSSPALLIFLTACTSLKSFTCWMANPELLSALPHSVETLQICKTYVFHTDLAYDSLLSRSDILSHIRLIRWSGISEASLKAQRGGCELLADLAEMGIETQFGAVSQGHWYGLGLRY